MGEKGEEGGGYLQLHLYLSFSVFSFPPAVRRRLRSLSQKSPLASTSHLPADATTTTCSVRRWRDGGGEEWRLQTPNVEQRIQNEQDLRLEDVAGSFERSAIRRRVSENTEEKTPNKTHTHTFKAPISSKTH